MKEYQLPLRFMKYSKCLESINFIGEFNLKVFMGRGYNTTIVLKIRDSLKITYENQKNKKICKM